MLAFVPFIIMTMSPLFLFLCNANPTRALTVGGRGGGVSVLSNPVCRSASRVLSAVEIISCRPERTSATAEVGDMSGSSKVGEIQAFIHVNIWIERF